MGRKSDIPSTYGAGEGEHTAATLGFVITGVDSALGIITISLSRSEVFHDLDLQSIRRTVYFYLPSISNNRTILHASRTATVHTQ